MNLKINALSMAWQVEEIDQSTSLQSKYLQSMQLEVQREKATTAIEKRQEFPKEILIRR